MASGVRLEPAPVDLGMEESAAALRQVVVNPKLLGFLAPEVEGPQKSGRHGP